MLGPKLGCIILGSGGLVSQRFQQRLCNHPFFELRGVIGSPNSVGKNLLDLPWYLDEKRPPLPDISIIGMKEGREFVMKNDIQIVFSALPSEIAAHAEPLFVKSGCMVYSNASYHRMLSEVPLVIPEVNSNHLEILDSSKLGIVCSTNCTVMPVALSIKPIYDLLDIKNISIQTEQSVSGGGLELLISTRLGNTPSTKIPGEAEKIEEELIRLLSNYEENEEIRPEFDVSVSCKRVNRDFGHIVHIEIETNSNVKREQIIEQWTKVSPSIFSDLPSSPTPHIIVKKSIDKDNDRWAGSTNKNFDPAENLHAGMAIVTTIPEISGNIVKWSAFSENTIRGAAGGCILLAELDSMRRGIIPLSSSGEGYNPL